MAGSLPGLPIVQRWWAYMADLMETNPDNSPGYGTIKPRVSSGLVPGCLTHWAYKSTGEQSPVHHWSWTVASQLPTAGVPVNTPQCPALIARIRAFRLPSQPSDGLSDTRCPRRTQRENPPSSRRLNSDCYLRIRPPQSYNVHRQSYRPG